MKRFLALPAAALALPLCAQTTPEQALSPNQIVEQAAPAEWVAIAPEDLLVMTLAPDAQGRERQVVIQLIPPPFSQGWVENIRTLARAGWYDGLSINRVQDNYVVQWGDPDGEDAARAKKLPEGLRVIRESDYTASVSAFAGKWSLNGQEAITASRLGDEVVFRQYRDSYSDFADFSGGWPVVGGFPDDAAHNGAWPVHCYGMVGVGRGMPPDTGSGAELYAVIGHAPRHLDRNIALVGRVVEGMEHLSSLPRGTGELGFYETAEERVPIRSVRLVSDLPKADWPRFEYLSTEDETFARYAEARANRRDPFFIQPAGGADICNIPVPVRRVGD